MAFLIRLLWIPTAAGLGVYSLPIVNVVTYSLKFAICFYGVYSSDWHLVILLFGW